MAAAAHSRRALITGVTGQDGSILAEQLLDRGYEVTGLIRGGDDRPLASAEHLRGRLQLCHGDLLDRDSLAQAVADVRPDELYHLAAPSFVPKSWERPAMTLAAVTGATAALLEAVRDRSDHTRVFVAVSSAMYGAAAESPQSEDTACRPDTPYGTAKLAAHQLTGQLRAHEHIFACSGILYNHESERRPEWFVTRKITRAAAAIKLGLATELALGDVSAIRDWSFAGDIMHGAWLMLQHDPPDDYVLASGTGHRVAEFAEIAFAHVGLDAHEHIRLDAALRRDPEPTPPVGDPTRAREQLGWTPTMTFEQLIARMVDADLKSLQ